MGAIEMTGRDGEKEEERERREDGSGGDRPEETGDGRGGDPTVSGSGGDPATKATVAGDGSGGSEDGREREIDVGGSSGLGGGDDVLVPERVEERREERGEGRDEEMVEVHEVGSDGSGDSEETVEEIGERGVGGSGGGDRVESTSGVTRTRVPRWRIEPRPSQRPSEGDKGKAAVIGGELLTRGQSSGLPAQGPVGISREDYLEHAPPEVVMAAAADAPGILDAAREAVVESREREATMFFFG